MNDRPTAAELIDAARLFLEKELLPALADARLRFQALVAANVLAVASRELAGEEPALAEEHRSLTALLRVEESSPATLAALRAAVRRLNEALCERIRSGDFDAPERWRDAESAVRRQVVRKLEVANPRYLPPAGG